MKTEGPLSSEEQILAKATKQAIQAAGGLDVCAGETAISPAQLSRCSSPHNRDSITIRDANAIEAISHGAGGHPHILRALARLAGFILIELPQPNEDPDGLVQSIMELTSELGDVAEAVRDALRDDKVEPAEATAALRQLEDVDQASAKLRRQLANIINSARDTTG